MDNLQEPAKNLPRTNRSPWSTQGELSRTGYVAWGSSLFGLKLVIDTLIAELIFHRHWSLLSYLMPGQSLDFLLLSAADRAFYLTISAIALPFIWLGVVLTIRRLRSAGLPVFLAFLFFVPFINLMFFTLLSLYPPRKQHGTRRIHKSENAEENPEQLDDSAHLTVIDQCTPEVKSPVLWKNKDKSTDAARALLATCTPALALAWLGIFALQSYGWGLFVGLPFALGMSSSYLYGHRELRTMTDCFGIALVATTVLGLGMFFFAWEGMACLVMAAPIVYVLSLMGALLGYHFQKNKLRIQDQSLMMLAIIISLPALMGAEYAQKPQPPLSAVISSVEIPAPPAVVWKHVIAFPELDPPDELLFKIGIAYPVGATICGEGPGAVRNCNFSTGAFVEPIEVWDAPKLLKFSVQSQPPSMREFSWMHEIHPAHLKGYLEVQGGQFQLEPITKDGKIWTKLVGTTWYQNRMWPNPYWRLWSDEIIHRIHLRVLNHIQKNVRNETT